MRKAFEILRLVGLLALLAGFMAFSASAAQAEGEWLKEGTAITGNTPVNAKIDKEVVLLTKVGAAKVEVLCAKIKLVGANLQVGGLASGKLHFEECITKLNGSAAGKCTPHSPGHAEGLVETSALAGSLRLHAVSVVLFELLPVGFAAPFVVLQLGTGGCAIGNNIEILGKVFLEDTQSTGLVDRVEHLFEEEPFLSELRFGFANLATLDGSAFGFLGSPSEGSTFAGHV